jgi:hypothetical protein
MDRLRPDPGPAGQRRTRSRARCLNGHRNLPSRAVRRRQAADIDPRPAWIGIRARAVRVACLGRIEVRESRRRARRAAVPRTASRVAAMARG